MESLHVALVLLPEHVACKEAARVEGCITPFVRTWVRRDLIDPVLCRHMWTVSPLPCGSARHRTLRSGTDSQRPTNILKHNKV